ncbi:MAG: CpaF family protein [Anaerolineae bacterium]|jgi:pilus assembly protein CpaF|nr:CpaF family protein [Anaerolineae bacterium]
MSSFLSKRLQDQQKREADEKANREAAFKGFDEPTDPGLAEPAAASTSIRTAEETLDTGYVVPSKVRTSSRVAQLRKQLRPKMLAFPDEADLWHRQDTEKQKLLIDRMRTILSKMNLDLTAGEIEELKEGLLNDLLGFGAIQPLVENRQCSEIMVNGPSVIFAETKGKLRETEYVFDDEDHVLWTAQRIVRPLQRSLNRANPMVDARLPDGSRVHIVTLPSALQGTTLTIRKFPDKRLTIADLVKFGSITEELALFLEACVVSRLNVVVAGGTGSGKTTLLNVLSSFIPEDERIITVEDSAELNLAQRHVVRLETAPPLPGTKTDGRLEIRDLVKGTLRMRPDRLVIGECRSGEALDMLQAMNTGHDGSLTTVHANTPRDAVARLETLCLMAGMDLPVFVIRQQIASAVNLFVQQARLKDGSRKVVQVTEMQGMEGENVTLQDIFVYRTPGQKNQGYSHEGGGKVEPTGFRPNFADKFKQYGYNLSAKIFGVGK